MLQRLKSMLIKEFIQALRNPRMRYILFLPPLIQLIVFGYAANTDIRNISLAVYDMDNSPESREMIENFASSGYFRISDRAENPREIRRWMDEGKISAALQINNGFARERRQRQGSSVQIIVDGTDSNTASVVMTYAQRIVAEYSRQILAERIRTYPDIPDEMKKPFFARGGIEVQSRAFFNPNLESRNFYVPGIMAFVIMLVTLMLTTMAIVREREIGTMEQLIVSPIRPVELILGKTIPFALIGYIDVLLVTGVGVFWFEVPIRGSPRAPARRHHDLPPQHPGHRPFYFHHLPHPAAGHDDHVLLLRPGHPPLRLRLPHRQHAGGGPIPFLRRSSALLPGHHPGHIPQGQRVPYPLAPDARPGHPGRGRFHLQLLEI